MSNELELRIGELSEELADDIKALRAANGDLSLLPTNAKSSMVAAFTELFGLLPSTGVGDMLKSANLAGLTDLVQARSNLEVMSATQVTFAIAGISLAGLGGVTQAAVDQTVTAAIQEITGMPVEAFNTLQKIANELASDNDAFSALTNTVSTKVSYTAAQVLTAEQKQQACQNIGIGNPNADFRAVYRSRRDSA